MTLWLDNQLPPTLAGWIRDTLAIDCLSVRDLNLQRASDPEIVTAARQANVVVMTKDADFVDLLEQQGPHPRRSFLSPAGTRRTRACGAWFGQPGRQW